MYIETEFSSPRSFRKSTIIPLLICQSLKLLSSLVTLSLLAQIARADSLSKFKVATPALVENFDPIKAWNIFESILMSNYCSTLTKINENGEITANLLKKWSISPDMKTYRLILRDNIKFHDGTNLSAEDVAWSVSRHLWPSSNSSQAIYFKNAFSLNQIEIGENKYLPNIKIISGEELVIELKRPYLPLLKMFSSIVTCIVKKGNPRTGTGPFKLHQYSDGKWTLKRFDNYFEKTKFPADTIEIFNLPDNPDAITNLKNHDIDLLIGTYRSEPKGSEYLKSSLDYTSINYLMINPEESGIPNTRNREIIGTIVQLFAWRTLGESGLYRPITEILPFEAYNVKKAITMPAPESLLKELKQNLPASKKLRFVFYRRSFDPVFFERLKEVFQQYALPLEIKLVENDTYASTRASKEYDLINVPATISFPDPDGLYLMPSDFFKHPYHNYLYGSESARHLGEKRARVREYSKLLAEYRSQFIIVPCYEIKIPILVKKGLSLPRTRFKSTLEIWNIDRGERK